MLFIQIRSKLFFFRNKERAAAFVAPEEKAKAKTTEVSICYIVETDKDVHPTILIWFFQKRSAQDVDLAKLKAKAKKAKIEQA